MLSLLAVITYLDRVCIAVAGPRMQDALHISPEAWGWVTSVFFLSYSAFEIPTGALGDRVGPRRVLARIVAWWSAFTALTGVVSNYYVLLVVRFCFGAGEAGAYPNASVVIGRWIPLAKRTRAWGIVWMTSQVGAALSPLLVVPIQMRYGLRNGRRWLGVAGLSAAALFLTAAIFAPDGRLALAFLSCAYGGILFQQPTLCALCLDVGRKNAGAVFGFMNTAANASSAMSAVVFGYLVGYFGNYNTPFIPMVALLSLGALLWLQVDPTVELFPETVPDESKSATPAGVLTA